MPKPKDFERVGQRSERPVDAGCPRDETAGGLEHSRGLIDAVPAIVWHADLRTSRFTFVSRYAETLLGYPLRSWMDEPAFWKDHIYPEDREFIVTHRADALRAAGAYDLEYRMIAADGRVVWVRELGHFPPGDIQRATLAGVIVDLGQKRSSEEALGKRKLWLRQVIDSIPQQIWSGPADGSNDFTNARLLTEMGLTADDFKGNGWQRIVHPDDRDRVLKAWHDSVMNGTPYEQEERHRTADGQYRWFLNRGVAQRDEQGRVIRWYGTHTDIENQKRAEEELRKSEQRWRAVFDNARVGIALLDSSMHFVAVNLAYEKMAGLPFEKLCSMTCMDLTDERDRSAYGILEDELRSGKRDRFEIEKRYRRKDGEVVWVRANGSSLPSIAGEPCLWVVMVEDITEPKRLRDELERERDYLRLLVDLTHQFIAKLELPSVVDAVVAGLHQRDGWEWAAILLPELSTDRLKVYLNRGAEHMFQVGATLPIKGTISGKVYQSGQAMLFRAEDLPRLAPEYNKSQWMQDVVRSQRLMTGCALPLEHGGRVLGVLFLGTSAQRELAAIDLRWFRELGQLVAAVISNAKRYDELTSSNQKLVTERIYTDEQIREAFEFGNIVGRSKALRDVLQQANTVAPTDSAVLILGETGTGKELLARAIHDHSSRRDQAFVKVDCSAIPTTLLESELFGHERGAFTGAIAQKLGRFEIADKGTLFLDEVGDIPLELQTKLLRVLQDQAFERIGSNQTLHLDVRIIAATNRDLEDLVDKGEFRADLYYRLKVFPIIIPPLRERREDIPLLVWHYVNKHSHRMRKTINKIPAGAMEIFKLYPWPGNVRELQHFIERCVVLTSGHVLEAPLRELEQVIRRKPAIGAPVASRTMEEIERESILQALRESNWVVGGPRGAAAKLGLRRTTLASRMERLGISRRR